jgi:hypothetical protein
MAENQSITGSEVSEPQVPPAATFCGTCGEMFEPGKNTCWRCEGVQRDAEKKAAARQKLIEESTEPEYLDAMLSQAVASFKSFCVILDNEEYDKVRDVLAPLVERLEADLERIEAIISETLGQVQVLVCTDPMRIDDKCYGTGDFYQAVLTPKRSRGGAGPLQ